MITKLKIFENLKDKNTFTYKGRKYWSGAVNQLDGVIEEVHTYQEAESSDWHHSFYFSLNAIEKMKDDEWLFFCVREDGDIDLEWRSVPNNFHELRLSNIIEGQIKINESNPYFEILEFLKPTLYPKELKNKNILYHSTFYDSLNEILETDVLYGSINYDWGIATSRNRDYAFGMGDGDVNDEDNYHHNIGEVQLILDRDKIKENYKIKAYDWERWKTTKSETGKFNDFHQSEDKILTNKIVNIHKYIIGFQFVKDEFIGKMDDIFKESVIKYNYVVYDSEWNNITEKIIT
jgi:hypothetical protein